MSSPDNSAETQLLNALFGSAGNVSPTSNSTSSEKTSEDPAYLETWQSLLEIDNKEELRRALFEHFFILTDTRECELLLKRILKHIQKVDIIEGCLELSFEGADQQVTKLICYKPSNHNYNDWPSACMDIFHIHGGLSFPDKGPKAFESCFGEQAAVFLNGPELPTLFEPCTESEEQLLIGIDTHQDWYTVSREEVNALGKPLVRLLKNNGRETQLDDDNLSIGGVFLRLIALFIVDYD